MTSFDRHVDHLLTPRQLELLVRLAGYSDAHSRKGKAPNVPLCGMCWKGRTNGRGLASCANSLDKLGLIRKWNTRGGFYIEVTEAGRKRLWTAHEKWSEAVEELVHIAFSSKKKRDRHFKGKQQ